MSHKILTVDDSRMVRLIVARAFQPYGCEVYEAGNGTDGLMTAQAIQPDLIGLDLLEKLRAVTSLTATPVIMLTAESGSVSIERADKLKVIGYISKPFKAERLLELAGTVLKLEPLATA
jgi:CheY-like chemotaxis protein